MSTVNDDSCQVDCLLTGRAILFTMCSHYYVRTPQQQVFTVMGLLAIVYVAAEHAAGLNSWLAICNQVYAMTPVDMGAACQLAIQ